MNSIKVLLPGYARVKEDGSWEASSTVTLIESNGKKIIVDPGTDRILLLESLKTNQISTKDIDWVFVSHSHLDHNMLAGIFENASVIDGELYQNGPNGKLHEGFIPETEVEIMKTPGHTSKHASLLLKTSEGVYAIAGDVFWWAEGIQQTLDIEFKDDFAEDVDSNLQESRKLILEKADWIIPGHGKTIKVPKNKT